MGLLGAAQIEAHAIALNIAATAFMVPLGLGMAATVRVGHAYRRARRAAASRAPAGRPSASPSPSSPVSALVMALAPRLLVSAFLDTDAPRNAATLAFALGFVRIAAVFQLADGAQAALSNMLRGVQDSRVPMAMAIVGYWGIGAPAGLALGFPHAARRLWPVDRSRGRPRRRRR